jgi:hypothetical protein
MYSYFVIYNIKFWLWGCEYFYSKEIFIPWLYDPLSRLTSSRTYICSSFLLVLSLHFSLSTDVNYSLHLPSTSLWAVPLLYIFQFTVNNFLSGPSFLVHSNHTCQLLKTPCSLTQLFIFLKIFRSQLIKWYNKTFQLYLTHVQAITC